MENRFATAMSKRTDKDLIKITRIEQRDYDPLAVEAAEAELQRRNLDAQYLQDITDELTKAFEQRQEKEKNHIDVGTRIIHMVVDGAIYNLIAVFLFVIVIFAIKPQDELQMQLILYTVYATAFFSYYMVMEYTYQKTVGKFITKTKVVLTDGSKPDVGVILLRTICRLIPFDAISFISGKDGFHDTLSKTTLVKEN